MTASSTSRSRSRRGGPAPGARQLDWNHTAAAYPREATIHGLFADVALSRPDAVALVCGDARVTYAQLDAASDALAARLHAAGVTHGDLVPVCLDRTPELVAALLAVLKAGAAYVALDPAYPRKRIDALVSDAEAPVVVTSADLEPVVAAPGRRLVQATVTFDGIRTAPPVEDATGRGDDVAYVLYTSGSTGTPKGVVVPHRGVVRLVVGSDFAAMGPDETWLQLAPLSFDLSTLELWAPLLHGGRCVLYPGRIPTVLGLRAAIRDQGVTSMWLTSTLFNTIVDEDATALAGLRQLLIGGEALSPPHVAKALEALPDTRLVNGYGPTENTTFTTCHPIEAADAAGASIPIGKPIANTTAYVVDDHGALAPVGEPGELWTGGDGVALGYLRRPELTAERFVPDVFGADPERTLYRTGDLARWRADGVLEFLGRLDGQVKVRGFRIEPGEIEVALMRMSSVRQAAVAAHDDGRGTKRLVAYVVPEDPTTCEDAALRQGLARELPEYMIPAAFVRLESLPRTPSGKVDRRRLPDPAARRTHGSAAPSTNGRSGADTEGRVLAIWRDVLAVPDLAPGDDFFEAGGHSLLAIRALARIRATLAVEVSIRTAFEHRTAAAFAREIDARASDARLDAPIDAALDAATIIGRLAPGGASPLTPAQSGLWFEQRLEPLVPAYNEPFCVRLEGPLDADRLEACIAAIVVRHEALRTRFLARDDGPRQTVVDGLRVPLERRVWPADDEEALHAELRAEAARPFPLETGPLLRACLFSLSGRDHALLVTFHHLIVDDWSVDVFFRELGELYSAAEEGREARLPPLPVQVRDVAAWRAARLDAARLAPQRAYWRERLAGAVLDPGLPTDAPRDAAHGAEHAFGLGDLGAATRALAAREGASAFMVALAAFVAFLHRVAYRDDVTVGTPVAVRERPEMADLIGYFLTTTAIRTDVSGEPSFRELVSRVREAVLGAQSHRDVPLDEVLAAVRHGPDGRDGSRRAALPVVFVHRLDPSHAPEIPGVGATPVHVANGAAKFDLMLSLDDVDGMLHGRFEYRCDVYAPETVARFAEQFALVLAAAVEAPDAPLSRLPLHSATEPPLPSEQWTEPAVAYPRDATLHALFEEQVDRTPDAIAVSTAHERVSYRELDRRANRIAWRLLEMGTAPGDLVPVCAFGGPERIAGVLGILKAGAAYVPLDPSDPLRRLDVLLHDAGAKVLVTERSLSDELPRNGFERLLLRDDPAGNAAARDDRPAARGDGTAPACVLYRSDGSGTPAGVVLPHRAVSRLALATAATAVTHVAGDTGGAAGDAWLQLAPTSHDAAVLELFAPLLTGARLALAPTAPPSVEQLRAALEDGITSLWAPAALFRAVMDDDPQVLGGLRRVFVERAALSPAHVAAALRELPDVRIVSAYGGTEGALLTACHVLTNGDGRDSRHLPLGRPVASACVHVVDRHLEPVPVGVTGELVVGGEGVALGYHGRPGLESERFVDDPLGSATGHTTGGRLYRTGDLARRRPDGTLELLGRIDDRVTIWGVRVEPGEVRATLAAHPDLVDVAVVPSRADDGSWELAAYFVPRPGARAPSHEELRRFAAETLPDAMVPAGFVALDELPRAPDGRFDGRRVPDARPVTAEIGDAVDAPRTELERQLLDIWRAVLRIDTLGIHDDFFHSGGHSLLAVQVFSRLEKLLGRRVPVATIFRSPTVARLAREIEAAPSEELPAGVVEIQPGGDGRTLFCLPGIGGHVFMFRELARRLDRGLRVVGLQIQDLEIGDHSLDSIESIARAFVERVRSVQPRGPYRLAGYSFGGSVAYEMAQQLSSAGEEVRFVGLFDAFAPGALDVRPQYQKVFLHLGELARRGPRAQYRYLADRVAKRLRHVRLWWREVRGRDAHDDVSLPQHMSEIRVRCLRAARAYVAPPYAGRIDLFRAARMTDWMVRGEDADTNGWEPLVGRVEIADVQCEHLELFREPYIDELAAHLSTALTATDDASD